MGHRYKPCLPKKRIKAGEAPKCESSTATVAVLSHLINCFTSLLVPLRLEAVLCMVHPKWGRHGFDGDACGQEACQGARTCNRGQNDNCQSRNGIRSLIN